MSFLIISLWVCVFIIVYTYFIYPLFLLLISHYGGSQSRNDSSDEKISWPKVTLLIAAYNEEQVIERKINNSLLLHYPAGLLDIWIASDGSSDATNDIVKVRMQQNKSLNLIELPRLGKSEAINKAMASIKSDIIVFSDANTEYSNDAILKLVGHFDNPSIGCVCGRLIYRNPEEVISGKGESFYWRYETKLKKLESALGYVAGANGAIYAIRKELFVPLPSWTINDDFTISMKIVMKGYKCIYEENAIAYEDVAPSMESEFARHVRDGAGHYIAVRHLTGLLNPMLGVRSVIYWSHRIMRWSVPFLLIYIFIASLILSDIILYRILLIAQLVFYGTAFVGLMTINRIRLPFIVYIPFYFSNLNLALLYGFLKVISGIQKPTWESTARSD